MRRFAAYLLLAAGTGLVLETGLIRADDDGKQSGGKQAERLEDGGAPGAGRGRGGERGERGRRRRGRSGEGGRPEGGPGHHGPPPIIAALDANADGVISASEIEGAVAALKTLDKNEDGELSMEELRPKRSGRGDRPGGAAGRGGPPSPEQFIKKAMESDADGDGAISKDEAPERMLRRFDHIDADGNGLIEKSELEAAAKRFGQRRPGKDGPGGKRKKGRRPAPDDSEV